MGALCLAGWAPSSADSADQTYGAPGAGAARTGSCHLNRILRPTCGVLFGAYAHPTGSQSPEQAFRQLQRRTGTKLRVMHFYHQGRELFPTPWEMKLSRQGHRLLLNWKPEDGHTWAEVARGAADSYIDAEASYLRHHYARKKFFLVIHHEPENEINTDPASGMTAADFARMFRHVEDRLKSDGVRNAVYVINYMGAQTYFLRSWHRQLWPGRKYVDWIGLDRYATPDMGGQEGGFAAMVNRHWGHEFRGAYHWAAKNHPHKPVMLVEWGVAEKPGSPSWKSRLFTSVTRGLDKMPHLKLLSYFNSSEGRSAGDVRADTTSTSMAGWRRLAAAGRFHR